MTLHTSQKDIQCVINKSCAHFIGSQETQTKCFGKCCLSSRPLKDVHQARFEFSKATLNSWNSSENTMQLALFSTYLCCHQNTGFLRLDGSCIHRLSSQKYLHVGVRLNSARSLYFKDFSGWPLAQASRLYEVIFQLECRSRSNPFLATIKKH